MLKALWRWIFPPFPEPRAIGQLRTIANEHDGNFFVVKLADEFHAPPHINHLARIEWLDGKRILAGEARGATPLAAATQLLASLRARGMA